MLQRFPITLKALLATLLVGITIWSLLDHWQTSHLQTLFQERLKEAVGEKTEINRVVFDQHVKMHHQAVHLLAAQRHLLEYLEQREASEAATRVNEGGTVSSYQRIIFHHDPPVWFPKPTVLRGMLPLRYVLLMENNGPVREVYRGQLEPPPPALLDPSSLLRQLSHGQPFITSVDGLLFLLTTESVQGRDGQAKALLMLATPLDSAFLANTQGVGGQYNGVVALLEGSQQRIIASNKPQIAPPGMALERVLGPYLVAGQSFFDYGASDLLLQLITLVSTESFDSLIQSIMQVEHRQRLIGSSVSVLVCLLILLWVTRNIRQLTREVMLFSRTVLGSHPQESSTRDELWMLRERFHSLAREIVQTRDSLQAELEERKRAEWEVRKLSQAVEQGPAAVMICDLKGNIVYVNRQFTRLTGYGAEEVMGRNPRFLQSGETPLATYQSLWQTITRGEVWHGELRNRRKDGLLYWELNTISQILAPEQREKRSGRASTEAMSTFYLAFKEDVSPRIAMEKALQQAKEAAETVNQIKNDFLSNISHELRTPLNTIAGCTSLLLDMEFGELNKSQKRYLHNILNSSERLSALISDLLDLSKVNSEQFTLESRFFDLTALIRLLKESIDDSVEEKGLGFSLHLAADVPHQIKGDPVRLRQVLMHILHNAIKFTQEGEITLTVTRDGSRAADPGMICFTVTDTGIGIPEEKQQTIFELFTQVDSSSSRRYEGTGLGLTIAKRLIELMGGTIRLKSRVNEGSIFSITIPFAVAQSGPESGADQPPPAGLKTAVVGKNPVNRLILKKLLTSLGLQVSEVGHCQTPAELLELYQAEQWDFVCLECVGGSNSGVEEISRLRAEEPLRLLPVIVFSNLPSEQRERLEQLPGVFCLDRPMQRSQLCRIVRQAVGEGAVAE
ncbi:ATP-binding protein [Candidatus Magnetaquicoccus inordinatus]|uniref:hybrid sensor histidine kinase/response regulator n=1 Tax=Candidatus Magnetaquicoccus inordinatus TaxID=2496818 RepID=UPI00102BC50A|nr:ATP-binding protein [Candidatus Magnetaquicoccus inordinatus]